VSSKQIYVGQGDFNENSLRGEAGCFSQLVVFLFISSCSSYYWTSIDDADLVEGDQVYKVKTLAGETVNFRSRPRSSGIFNGEEIYGVDESGNELTLGLDEISVSSGDGGNPSPSGEAHITF